MHGGQLEQIICPQELEVGDFKIRKHIQKYIEIYYSFWFPKMDCKSFLTKQLTEQLTFEVNINKCEGEGGG